MIHLCKNEKQTENEPPCCLLQGIIKLIFLGQKHLLAICLTSHNFYPYIKRGINRGIRIIGFISINFCDPIFFKELLSFEIQK